jgi:hypothetical protein
MKVRLAGVKRMLHTMTKATLMETQMHCRYLHVGILGISMYFFIYVFFYLCIVGISISMYFLIYVFFYLCIVGISMYVL